MSAEFARRRPRYFMRARRNRSLSARYGSVENPWLAKHVVRFKLDCQGRGFNSPRLHQPSPEAPRRAKAAFDFTKATSERA